MQNVERGVMAGHSAAGHSAAHKPGHMPGLDGLRGLLIVGIVAYHLGYADHAFITVDTFFALSGFLITGLLLDRTPTTARELRSWWARRFRRLVPAVAVLTVVVVVVFRTRPGVSGDGLATMTWWANWRQAFGATNYWSPGPSPLRHAWTLSIEEQFYLTWPVLVAVLTVLARRYRRSAPLIIGLLAAIAALASFAWAAWAAGHGVPLNRIYLGTDTRAGALLLGCATATVAWRWPMSSAKGSAAVTVGGVLGAVTVVVVSSTLTIDHASTYQGGLAVGAAGSVLLVVAASRPGPLTSVLAWRPLQWLGVRSYGAYLWAWPVQMFLEDRRPTPSRPLVAVATYVLAFVFGDLSLRLVEMPLRGRSGWAARPRLRRVAWAAGLTALVVVVTGVALAGSSRPVYQSVSAEESGRAAVADALASQSVSTTTVTATVVPTAPPATTVSPAPATAATAAAPAAPAAPFVTSASGPNAPPPPQPGLRVMTAGDSQAFKAAFPKIPRRNLPPYIESITDAGVLGCGILVRAPEWTMYDPARGGDVSGAYCRDTAEVAEVQALKAHPDWMVLFSGGFERPFGYKDRTGRLVPARDPELRASIIEHLSFRIERARAAGTRTALVEWACMGEEVGDAPKAEWTRWHNAILGEAAAAIPGTILIAPNDQVCVDSDPTGRPTPEKEAAWGHEVHPVDLTWLWRVQLGPSLLAASR